MFKVHEQYMTGIGTDDPDVVYGLVYTSNDERSALREATRLAILEYKKVNIDPNIQVVVGSKEVSLRRGHIPVHSFFISDTRDDIRWHMPDSLVRISE